MTTAITLMSGGYDSVVLLSMLKKEYDYDIYAMFFNYGQAGLVQERNSARHICTKLGVKLLEIDLPTFTWSQAGMLKGKENYDPKDVSKDYVELRNLIFISYAMSFGQTVKATKIFSALLKWCPYKDTTPQFLQKVNALGKYIGITVETPFIKYNKDNLAYLGILYGVKPQEYFSCNHPVKGKPCGVCDDCTELHYIENFIFRHSTPKQTWICSKNIENAEESFRLKFLSSPIRVIRLSRKAKDVPRLTLEEITQLKNLEEIIVSEENIEQANLVQRLNPKVRCRVHSNNEQKVSSYQEMTSVGYENLSSIKAQYLDVLLKVLPYENSVIGRIQNIIKQRQVNRIHVLLQGTMSIDYIESLFEELCEYTEQVINSDTPNGHFIIYLKIPQYLIENMDNTESLKDFYKYFLATHGDTRVNRNLVVDFSLYNDDFEEELLIDNNYTYRGSIHSNRIYKGLNLLANSLDECIYFLKNFSLKGLHI